MKDPRMREKNLKGNEIQDDLIFRPPKEHIFRLP